MTNKISRLYMVNNQKFDYNTDILFSFENALWKKRAEYKNFNQTLKHLIIHHVCASDYLVLTFILSFIYDRRYCPLFTT